MSDKERARLFQDVGRLFPGEVVPVSVPPETSVVDALCIMLERRYSQLPVIENGNIRGLFSLWSLAQQLAASPKMPIYDLSVEDVMEAVPRVTVEDSLYSVLDMLEKHEAVLVASPHGLQAVATLTDALRHFYRVARPFVLLQEIELALRDLMQVCAAERLRDCIERALVPKYRNTMGKGCPRELHEMTFEDYRTLITNKENWPLFEGVLGRNRELTSSKLERVREIRNSVFHFHGDVSVMDHQTLVATREWLFGKVQRLRESKEGTSNA